MTVQISNSSATLDQITTKIKACLSNISANVVEIGRQLILAKSQISHGGWTSWLNENFGLGERTARNYMSVAALASKTENVFRFQPAAMIELAKLPPTAVGDFLASMERQGVKAESLSIRELKKSVKSWRSANLQVDRNEPVTIDVDAQFLPVNLSVEATSLPVVVEPIAGQIPLFPYPLVSAADVPPEYLIPTAIRAAAEQISAPVSIVGRAVKELPAPPAVIVATASLYRYWVKRLETMAAALIPARILFTCSNGTARRKLATILYFGDDVQGFTTAFREWGEALSKAKGKPASTGELIIR